MGIMKTLIDKIYSLPVSKYDKLVGRQSLYLTVANNFIDGRSMVE